MQKIFTFITPLWLSMVFTVAFASSLVEGDGSKARFDFTKSDSNGNELSTTATTVRMVLAFMFVSYVIYLSTKVVVNYDNVEKGRKSIKYFLL